MMALNPPGGFNAKEGVCVRLNSCGISGLALTE